MVTSALPGDGKTFTSINLALSMAPERDISVLLIDADVASGTSATIFVLAEKPGLLDALVHEDVEAEAHIVPTTTRGFSILPAGKPVGGRPRAVEQQSDAQDHGEPMHPQPAADRAARLPAAAGDQRGARAAEDRRPSGACRAGGSYASRRDPGRRGLFEPQHAGGVVLNQVLLRGSEAYYEYGSYGADGDKT